uniref:YD repeat-containing protein n=1 Tax=Romanomermis culicivorax TaxID=13658 RepID=A0A915HY38_ROMCU
MNVLNVEYDRNLNKDTFKDQSGLNILEVWYNNAGQITFWNPVRSQIIAPMNLTYDEQNSGKLAAIQWGSLNEFFKYDHSGRLVEFKSYRSQSLKTTKIGYHENSYLPKFVQTPSGNQYGIAFNDRGQLESISSSIDTYKFYQFVTLNHVHLAYSNRLSNFTKFFRASFSSDRKRLKSLIYPSGKRFAFFDQESNRTAIRASEDDNNSVKIEITRNDDREQIKFDNKYSKIETSITYQSFLPVNAEIKRIFHLDQKFASDVAFSYQYDNQFRPKKIQINLDGITLQSTDYEYNMAT